VEPQSARLLPSLIANIAGMKVSSEASEVADGCASRVAATCGDDADVEIKLDDDTASHTVHAFVLKAHSPVFRRMFEGRMAEAADRIVTIKHVSAIELDDFLRCLYEMSVPKEVQGDEGRLMSLLTLADRYEVLPLRDECATMLATRLSDTNMAAVLKVADMHQALELKAVALAFITSRPERIVAVMDTDDMSLRASIREYLQTSPGMQGVLASSREVPPLPAT
jgi:speckle-type POZ protein